jgi:hypothetical protein
MPLAVAAILGHGKRLRGRSSEAERHPFQGLEAEGSTPIRPLHVFPSSSAAEQTVVSRLVGGSNPSWGATNFYKLINILRPHTERIRTTCARPRPVGRSSFHCASGKIAGR